MSERKIIGLFLMFVGAIGGGYAIITYSNDTSGVLFGYTYSPPFTTHEITVIAIFVVALILVVVGIAMLAESKDNNISTNTAKDSMSEQPNEIEYCPMCGHGNPKNSKFCNVCGKALF